MLVHMLGQGGQKFTQLGVLSQILLGDVTQRQGGDNWVGCERIQKTCYRWPNLITDRKFTKNTDNTPVYNERTIASLKQHMETTDILITA